MFKYIDYSTWNLYDGFSEGSGRSEKNWLQSEEGTIGLFKYPKIDPASNTTTYEHVSEHIAHQLGNILGVKTAKVELGTYCGREGSMSYLVNGENEELREGVWFILGKYPQYNPDSMIDMASGEYYSIKQLFGIATDESLRQFLIEMMFFDFVLGNTDRHQNNWAFLVPIEDSYKEITTIRPCPLYDNGSSLCCYINDLQLDNYLGNDMTRFRALVDSKSRSIIRIDGNRKSRPCHTDVIRFLMDSATEMSCDIADRFIDSLTEEKIKTLIDKYPEEIISEKRKLLLIKYLNGKMSILKSIRLENGYG